jgi:hypothetical protein
MAHLRFTRIGEVQIMHLPSVTIICILDSQNAIMLADDPFVVYFVIPKRAIGETTGNQASPEGGTLRIHVF